MEELRYTIKRVINGIEHSIDLTPEEIGDIWYSFDNYSAWERAWDTLKSDYCFSETDWERCRDVINEIVILYKKNIGFGCDEETAWTEALSDCSYQIDELAGMS